MTALMTIQPQIHLEIHALHGMIPIQTPVQDGTMMISPLRHNAVLAVEDALVILALLMIQVTTLLTIQHVPMTIDTQMRMEIPVIGMLIIHLIADISIQILSILIPNAAVVEVLVAQMVKTALELMKSKKMRTMLLMMAA